MADKISIRPSEFVEGGIVPVEKNLTWKTCKFVLFDYVRRTGEVVATTCAAEITYVDDEGGESVQNYSAADPKRFTPSEDGKTLVPLAGAQALNQSSNFAVLMQALVSAGFPENRMDDDISALEGLYTFNTGVPEPKRAGLVREEGARNRVISVPTQILRLPWEKKGGKKAAAGKGEDEEAGDSDASAAALAMVAASLESSESVTRQQLATRAIREKQQAVAKFVFTDEFQAALLGGGYSIDGETIAAS